MMIDTHSHLYAADFEEDRKEVLERAKQIGVDKVFLPAIDSSTHDKMMKLVKDAEGFCLPMMGLHPCSVEDNHREELNQVAEWLAKEKFYAIGEVGLDFYHSTEFKSAQQEAFDIQIELALDHQLPLVIHSRSSMDECIKAIEHKQNGNLKGIFHCYGGDERQARKIIDLGFLLGIGGVVTYKNAGLANLVEKLPLSSMVIETDAPYLTPVPFRGKRNESSYIRYVAEKIASIKNISIEEIEHITTINAKKIFTF